MATGGFMNRPGSGVDRLALVRRGYDPDQVRRLVAELERELAELRDREEQLRRDLDARRVAPPKPVPATPVDEEDLVARVGAHSAAIVRRAHEEAAELVAAAEGQAAALVAAAHDRIAEAAAEAEERATSKVAEAELESAGILAEAQAAAEKAREVAHANGEMLVNTAREQGRGIVAEAREIRRKVLADMAEKRKAIHLQIEQMRAARDEIQRAVNGLQESVHDVLGNLAGSDDAARRAAQEVARRAPVPPPLAEEEVAERSPRGFEEAAELRELPTAAPAPAVEAEPRPSDVEPGQGTEAPEAPATPDAGVVEELFAKIRQSAAEDRPASDDEPTEATPVTTPASTPASTQAGQRREEQLAPIAANLARKLKRVLQDDQGQVLVQLRKAKGNWSEDLLEPEELHKHRYANAVADALAEAARCGAEFAGTHGAKGTPPPAQDVAAMAEAMASDVTGDLRRRLTADSDLDAADRVQAAYRPWRGVRVDEFVGDALVGAFGAGVVAASGSATLRWELEGSGCDGCGANASGPPVTAGSRFPSGHLHPPAHPSCRCSVLP